MNIAYEDADLETLRREGEFISVAVTRAYRKVLGIIEAAMDERDLRAMKSLRLEKLKGNRSHQHS